MTDTGTDAHPRAWGYLATLGWAALAVVLSTLITALAHMLLWRRFGPVYLLSDEVWFSLSNIVGSAVQFGALAFVARLAHWPPGEYLGLVRPRRRDAVLAIFLLALFIFIWEALTHLLRMNVSDAFTVRSYLSARTSGALPLFWFNFVVAASSAKKSCSVDFFTEAGFNRSVASCRGW